MGRGKPLPYFLIGDVMAVISSKVYPTSGETVPQPITFRVLLDDNGTTFFTRFISSKIILSLHPEWMPGGFDGGVYLEAPVLGLPAVGPGTFSTAPTVAQPPVPVTPPYHYVKVETVYELFFLDAYHEYTITTSIDSFIVGTSTPTLTSPSNGAVNQSINTDWLKEMIYDDADAESYSAYTVHFSVDGGSNFIPQNDRSRYSILSYKMWLGITLEYSTTYYWFVRKTVDEVDTDSDTWSFTTIDYEPPILKTRQKLVYGTEGDPQYETVPTGENNMMSVNRLIVAAANKIYYEDL